MLFSEPIFLLFFSGYFFLHAALPKNLLYYLLIIGSCFFYGYWNPKYLPLPLFLTVFTYLSGQWVENAANESKKKSVLIVSLIALFLPLLFYKYTNFFIGRKIVTFALPLGISFITFTLSAYLIDVYRGKFPAEKNIIYLLGSVLFFPHLIAGPIVRPQQLIPQLKRWDPKVSGRLSYGLLVFTIGLFKKLVIADPIGAVVNETYMNLYATHSAWDHLLAFYGFAIQIYCDFSGYTDMALGIASILGIRLPNNFSRPYLATSVVDFWTRWHITLSSWLRDYLYIPLGGNRKGWGNQIRNIFITMGLGGLWHGANWTFVIWGLFHAIGISFHHVLRRVGLNFRLPHWFQRILTFHFVTVGWVYFRAANVKEAHTVMRGIFTKGWGTWSPAFYFPVALMVLFLMTHILDTHRNYRFIHMKVKRLYVLMFVLFIASVCAVVSHGSSAEFIYFDF